MAETIKKSRIVSVPDEDMEESLLEEFNMRLKQCMSKEQQQQEQQQQEEENVVVRINGVNGIESNRDETERPEAIPTDENSLLDQEVSVKDRMFLSTDDASCLLFTQTVTSPMLTPSEENIDFLKGFRRDSDNVLYENVAVHQAEKLEESEERIYENVSTILDLKTQTAEFIHKETKAQTDELSSEIDVKLSEIKSGMYVQEIRNGIEERSPTKENLILDDKEEPEDLSSELIEELLVIEEPQEQPQEEPEIEQELEHNQVHEETKELSHGEIVQALKSNFLNPNDGEITKLIEQEQQELDELKSLNIMRQAISKFESTDTNTCSSVTESHYATQRTEQSGPEQRTTQQTIKKKTKKKTRKDLDKENISVTETNSNHEHFEYNVNVKNLCRSFGDLSKIGIDESKTRTKSLSDVGNITNNSNIENVFSEVSVRTLKSSFNKFDALQKKNALNGQGAEPDMDGSKCKKCGRAVFHMERIKAEKAIYHRNCFRCVECERQLLVDTFESHEGQLYCKPHFKALFNPRAVDDDEEITARPKHELIIRENQPKELPPDVVRASDKVDLGLDELHTLNVKERFQVFENINTDTNQTELTSPVNVKRAPSILSKLAKFQAKGMDVGVTDESLNGIPIDESASEEDEEDGEDADLIRAKKVQKEKPFHFVQIQDVKNKWEQGGREASKDQHREERKQEIQTIRSRLFHGKQGKMKEAYQQAIMEAETSPNVRKETPIEAVEMRSIKEKWEKGEVNSDGVKKTEEDMSVFESGIGKQSRSIFLELDANASKAPPSLSSQTTPIKVSTSVRNAREAYLARQANENTVRSTDRQDEVQVRTAEIQDRFKFFETYREPERARREFRITPPRDGQLKSESPEREIYKDPNIVRNEDYYIDTDKVIAKATLTTTKMLNKFRQMEENLHRGDDAGGLKPLKRFTPPREPFRREESSGESGTDEGEESEEYEESNQVDSGLVEAQKAARAKQLRAKFERWEEKQIHREQTVNVIETGEEQSSIESTKSLRSKFESLRDTSNSQKTGPRVKVNRFVGAEECLSCGEKVYPLEKVCVHEKTYHRNCFRCKECNCVLRMDSYSYNQGMLYCMTHFKRLFITKGNYDTAFGLEQHKDKWNNSIVA